MGSNNSSSSTSSSTPNESDCYLRNKTIRQQCIPTRCDNTEGKNVPLTQQYPNKLQIGCDNQGNVVECDDNGRITRVIKQNNNR